MATLIIHYKGGRVQTVETGNINYTEDSPREWVNRVLYLEDGRKQVVPLGELERLEIVVDGEAAGIDLLAGYPPLV